MFHLSWKTGDRKTTTLDEWTLILTASATAALADSCNPGPAAQLLDNNSAQPGIWQIPNDRMLRGNSVAWPIKSM